MNRIDRLTAILLLLQGGKRTAGEIAHRFEVSRGTILRDIQALCEIGIPITAELGISMYRYRELIVKLFTSQGFTEYPTTEPNVSMEPVNVLIARIGKRVDRRVANRFLNHLLSSSNLSRL